MRVVMPLWQGLHYVPQVVIDRAVAGASGEVLVRVVRPPVQYAGV